MKKLLVLLLLCSCTPTELYVKADRATYQAIAPEYIKYVDLDGQLSQDQKDRRHRLVEAWDGRIRAAELTR